MFSDRPRSESCRPLLTLLRLEANTFSSPQVNSFLRADEELSRAADGGTLADRESGSTALVALVAGAQLLVANAGDSRRVAAAALRHASGNVST